MGRTLQLSQCLGIRKLITLDHLTWVKTHDEQTLCLEQLSGKNQYCIDGVSHLSQGFALMEVDQTNVKLTTVYCAWEVITGMSPSLSSRSTIVLCRCRRPAPSLTWMWY